MMEQPFSFDGTDKQVKGQIARSKRQFILDSTDDQNKNVEDVNGY